MSLRFESARRIALSLAAACFFAGLMVSAAVPVVPIA